MRSTVPRLPLSLPVVTTTSSPFLILCMLVVPLQHFRRERTDLPESLRAHLARDRSEDAGADRLELRVQEHRRVRIELHQRPVGTAHAFGGAHHDGAVDLALLHAAARRCVLHAHLDDVTDSGITALGAAQYLDA